MILSPYQKPPIGTPLNRNHRFAKGLAGLWLMNEMSGDRIWDYSGNGNHGTCMNMAPQSSTSGWGPGPHGGALGLDGGDDYVDCGNAQSLKITSNITMIAWVNMAIKGADWRMIFSSRNLDSSIIPWELVWDKNADAFQFQLVSSGIKFAVDSISPVLGKWYFLAGVYDGSNLVIYRDAVRTVGSAFNGVAGSTTTPLTIGRTPNGLHIFGGSISSPSIYNRALSDLEVAILYARPFCMFEDEGFPAWMAPPAASQYYYRHLLAGGR